MYQYNLCNNRLHATTNNISRQEYYQSNDPVVHKTRTSAAPLEWFSFMPPEGVSEKIFSMHILFLNLLSDERAGKAHIDQ